VVKFFEKGLLHIFDKAKSIKEKKRKRVYDINELTGL
jgi:hypothetical protein